MYNNNEKKLELVYKARKINKKITAQHTPTTPKHRQEKPH